MSCKKLCRYSNDVLLVYPCGDSCEKEEILYFFREYLASVGIETSCADLCRVEEYLDKVTWILFVDEDELRAAETLLLYVRNRNYNRTILGTYQDFIGKSSTIMEREMNTYVGDLCSKGVHFINLIFEHNAENDDYCQITYKEIYSRYENKGRKVSGKIYPDMYRDFFDDLYTKEYAENIMSIKYSVETSSGLHMLKDCCGKFYNVLQGERCTIDQPENYKKTIYFVGPCYIYGHYVEDQYTIESFLQKYLNNAHYDTKVVNCGSLYYRSYEYFAWARIQALPLKRGDIIVYGGHRLKCGEKLNLLDVCRKHNAPAKWMADVMHHCNHKINQMFAEAIYEMLIPTLAKSVENEGMLLSVNHNYIKTMYIDQYFEKSELDKYKKVGAIVMNCNPFTYGHRYLIEQALGEVDFLIIFVVEEDSSLFTFAERFAMVTEGVKDLSNVKVAPSGIFILSKATFPEYFVKETDEEIRQNAENDIRIFAEKIAPCLNIQYRFVGEELEDKVTNEYNCAMKKILPEKGIKLVEIKRKSVNGQCVSASRVRNCICNNEMDELQKLIPKTTYKILFER